MSGPRCNSMAETDGFVHLVCTIMCPSSAKLMPNSLQETLGQNALHVELCVVYLFRISSRVKVWESCKYFDRVKLPSSLCLTLL